MSENLFGVARTRLAAASLLALCCLSACERAQPKGRAARASLDVAPESMGALIQNVVSVTIHGRRELVENSAAAMSVHQPGVIFTINDSGNEPLLFAIDTTGANRGMWRVSGVANADWEAASIGPCDAQRPSGCVYIGDTGENTGPNPSRAIYRVVEPTADERGGFVRPEVVQYTYPDQRHDVEAMYVAPNGDMVLITKRPLLRGKRLRPALVFRIPSSAWAASGRVVADFVDSLPIVPGSAPFRLITDASLAPDGHHLAVRTYAQVFIFATDSITGAVNHAIAPSVCDLASLDEGQGEGVTWVNNRGRLAFTSEGRRAPLNLGDCPLP